MDIGCSIIIYIHIYIITLGNLYLQIDIQRSMVGFVVDGHIVCTANIQCYTVHTSWHVWFSLNIHSPIRIKSVLLHVRLMHGLFCRAEVKASTDETKPARPKAASLIKLVSHYLLSPSLLPLPLSHTYTHSLPLSQLLCN